MGAGLRMRNGSYLLFDGDFAGDLMRLGHEDAHAQHEELCALFSEEGGG